MFLLSFQRSLQLQKKAFDRTITELEQKAANEVARTEVIEQLGDLVREREGIERKLSSTYSLGRDETAQGSLLPLSDRTTRSYSFRDANKESITVFHTVSDVSSADSESDLGEAWSGSDDNDDEGEEEEEIDDKEYEASPSSSGSSSIGGLSASFDGMEDAGVSLQYVQKHRMRSLSSSS